MRNLYLVIICILVFSCGHKKTPQGAKIEFENTECNVGKIKRGEKANCIFIIKNSGDSTLIFYNIIPNCDCTSLSNKNIEVPADKTDTLKFVLNTEGKELGVLESEIRIITNTIPDLHRLKIIAEIEKK